MAKRLACVPLMLLVLCAAAFPANAVAAFPGANGKVAFRSDRDGNGEIYVMNADGTAQTRLTSVTGNDGDAAWSADGMRIAFSTSRDGNDEIYVMNADGSAQTRVTNDPASDRFPTWSPDGSKIAFQRGPASSADIYSIDVDGTGETLLTTEGSVNGQPAWSPDGSRITFWRDDDIWVMNSDGAGDTQVTTSPFGDYEPTWSPNGSKIAFAHYTPSQLEIYSINSDGTGEVPLTNNGVDDLVPAWSPDGTQIAFQRSQDGSNSEVYSMNADGAGEIDLSNTGSSDGGPDWQPIPVNSYARPKGATPLRVSLVPAFVRCTVANRTHGPPLAHPACAPPVEYSHNATVGTPDANGQPAKSMGFVLMGVLVGNPATPADEADLQLTAGVTDVRNKAELTDYAGELQIALSVRITDRNNGCCTPGGTDAGTVTDLPTSFITNQRRGVLHATETGRHQPDRGGPRSDRGRGVGEGLADHQETARLAAAEWVTTLKPARAGHQPGRRALGQRLEAPDGRADAARAPSRTRPATTITRAPVRRGTRCGSRQRAAGLLEASSTLAQVTPQRCSAE